MVWERKRRFWTASAQEIINRFFPLSLEFPGKVFSVVAPSMSVLLYDGDPNIVLGTQYRYIIFFEKSKNEGKSFV